MLLFYDESSKIFFFREGAIDRLIGLYKTVVYKTKVGENILLLESVN